MDVQIVNFPETRVAVVEHRGDPAQEHLSVMKLVEWRIANRLSPQHHQSYGVHYNDPRNVPADQYRVDLCVSYDGVVEANPQGVITSVIPATRCAKARHIGSRENITTAYELYERWLPASGEQPGEFPIFFHYVNVGPDLQPAQMITDIYLPLS